MNLRALAWLALLPWSGIAHAGSLVAVEDANGWCSKVDDGDCREYFLADDPSLRIVHYGFEEGMRFDLFRRRGRRYSHQFSFEPVRPVAERPGLYDRLAFADGFAPVVDRTGDGVTLRFSFALTFEDDMGEMPADRWQKRVPAMLFERAGDNAAIDNVDGKALPMPFEALTLRQAIRRAKQPRGDCPPADINDRVIPCP